jgi:putative transposase
MGRKYKFHDNSKLYFVTFTVTNWIDVFIRQEYRDVIYDSLAYCQKEKGLDVYGYCIMPSHIHLIIGTEKGILSDIVRDFKAFTSRHIRKAIEGHRGESRKEWMLWMMKRAGAKNERNKDWQFWQQHNHPIELNNYDIALQRLNYLHNNPIASGFVDKAEEWVHSSAGEYYGIRKGIVELMFIER